MEWDMSVYVKKSACYEPHEDDLLINISVLTTSSYFVWIVKINIHMLQMTSLGILA